MLGSNDPIQVTVAVFGVTTLVAPFVAMPVAAALHVGPVATIVTPSAAAEASGLGLTTNMWGRMVWGVGAQGAKDSVGMLSKSQWNALGIDQATARGLMNFYRAAAAAWEGGEAATARADLTEKLLESL